MKIDYNSFQIGKILNVSQKMFKIPRFWAIMWLLPWQPIFVLMQNASYQSP